LGKEKRTAGQLQKGGGRDREKKKRGLTEGKVPGEGKVTK